MFPRFHFNHISPTSRRWSMGPHLIFLLLTGVLSACAPRVRDEPVNTSIYTEKIRLACVGDSITACDDCWPGYLEDKLGPQWEVENYGAGGVCVLSFGDKPFEKWMLTDVITFEPHVIVIMLGTNDSKLRHWYYKKDFEKDYGRLIQTLQHLEASPRIWICLPTPTFPGQWGIDDGRLREMQPVIRKIARKYGVPIIDLYTPFIHKADLFPDQVHPNAEASKQIAGLIVQALTGKAEQPAHATDASGQ